MEKPNLNSFDLKKKNSIRPESFGLMTHDLTQNNSEPFFNIKSKRKNPPSKLCSPNEVHISELQSLFRNPKQFMWLFGVELEYHLPPKSYITWPYMIMIVKGEKKLLKSLDITLTAQLPRFEQLSMKRIWPKFSKRKDILVYMPILGENSYPPRRYFFEILHSAFEEDFIQLINDAKEERTQKKKETNKVVMADPNLLREIRSLKIWTNIAGTKITKRVLVTPSKRKKKVAMNQLFRD
jgi:hypothetical protein